MTRHGSLAKLKPEYEEQYINLYRNISSGVLEQIKNSNISNYSQFFHNEILFSYFEYTGEDFQSDPVQKADDPIIKDWRKLTDPMLEPLAAHTEGELWIPIEEVFYMGEIKKPSHEASRNVTVVEILPEFIEEYIKLHKDVWHGVLEQLKRSNVQNNSIYVYDGRIYLYLEYAGNDFKADMDRIMEDPESLKWENMINAMVRQVPGAESDELWTEMKEIFHVD